jgi:hypothetical protein
MARVSSSTGYSPAMSITTRVKKERDVLDIAKITAFQKQKELEIQKKQSETERKITQIQKQREAKELSRRKIFVGKGRVTERGASPFIGTRTTQRKTGFEKDITGYKKVAYEQANKEYEDYNKAITQVNKELREYRPTKKETFFENIRYDMSGSGTPSIPKVEENKDYLKIFKVEAGKETYLGTSKELNRGGVGITYNQNTSSIQQMQTDYAKQRKGIIQSQDDFLKGLTTKIDSGTTMTAAVSLVGGGQRFSYDPKFVRALSENENLRSLNVSQDYIGQLQRGIGLGNVSLKKEIKTKQTKQSELNQLFSNIAYEPTVPKRFTDTQGTYFDLPTGQEQARINTLLKAEEKAWNKGYLTSGDIFRLRAIEQQQTPFGLTVSQTTQNIGQSIDNTYNTIDKVFETQWIPTKQGTPFIIGAIGATRSQGDIITGKKDLIKDFSFIAPVENKSIREYQDDVSKNLIKHFTAPARAGTLMGSRINSYAQLENLTNIEFENQYGYNPQFFITDFFTKKGKVRQSLIERGVFQDIVGGESTRLNVLGETEKETAKRLGYIGGTLYETAAMNLIPIRGAQWFGNIYEFSRDPRSGTFGILPGFGFGVATKTISNRFMDFSAKAAARQTGALQKLAMQTVGEGSAWGKFSPLYEGAKVKGFSLMSRTAKQAIYPLFAAESVFMGNQLYNASKTDEDYEKNLRRAFFAQEAGFNVGNSLGFRFVNFGEPYGGYRKLTADVFGVGTKPRGKNLREQITLGEQNVLMQGSRGSPTYFSKEALDPEWRKGLQAIGLEDTDALFFTTDYKTSFGLIPSTSTKFSLGKSAGTKSGNKFVDYYRNTDIFGSVGAIKGGKVGYKSKLTQKQLNELYGNIGSGVRPSDDFLKDYYRTQKFIAESSGVPTSFISKKGGRMSTFQENEFTLLYPDAKYVGEINVPNRMNEPTIRKLIEFEGANYQGTTWAGTPYFDVGSPTFTGLSTKQRAKNLKQFLNLEQVERELTRKNILLNLQMDKGYLGTKFPVQPGTASKSTLLHSRQASDDWAKLYDLDIGNVKTRGKISREAGSTAMYIHDYGKPLKGGKDYMKPFQEHGERLAKEIRDGDWYFMQGITKKNKGQIADLVETHMTIRPFKYGIKTGQYRKAFRGLRATPEQKLAADVDKFWYGKKVKKDMLFFDYSKNFDVMDVDGTKMVVTGKKTMFLPDGKKKFVETGYSLEKSYYGSSNYKGFKKGFASQNPFIYAATPQKYKGTTPASYIMPKNYYNLQPAKQRVRGEYLTMPKQKEYSNIFYAKEKMIPYKKPTSYKPPTPPIPEGGYNITKEDTYYYPPPKTKYPQYPTKELLKYAPPAFPPTKSPPQARMRKRKQEEYLKPIYSKGTFNAYARKNKNTKWTKVTKKPLPYNAAFNKGLMVADNTTARSVKLKKAGKKFRGIDDPFILSTKFRRRKSRSKVPGEESLFVEKSRFAIDTLGEKQGLKAAKYMKRGGPKWVF